VGLSAVHKIRRRNLYIKIVKKTNPNFAAMPERLPEVDVTLDAADRFRYEENVCVFSYTFAFWQWSDWERHIDWMALNGVNIPLAFTGQEEIWRRVYSKVTHF
jgi:hypothetical protein